MRISDWSSDVCSSDLFETEVRALWVPSGTAANCLALAALCPPHGSVICHRDAHIANDECGAPEFSTHGAQLRLADGPGATLPPESHAPAPDGARDAAPQVAPHAVSIPNATAQARGRDGERCVEQRISRCAR